MRALPRGPGLCAALVAVLCLACPTGAWAYCQTTTCDPTVSCEEAPEDCCILDSNGCDTNGRVIIWPSSCVSFAINQDASPLRDIDLATFDTVVDRSLRRWTDVQCMGGTPSIEVSNYGISACEEPDLDTEGANANVWMFRDAGWPYESGNTEAMRVDAAALALTTISFSPSRAQIFDADVEINSADAPFTAGDKRVLIDLESIVTHEAGHFLGLDHSTDSQATMAPGYVPGTVSGRTLSTDDEAGICASYPPGRAVETASCDPRGGYEDCTGCSVASTPGASAGSLRTLVCMVGCLPLLLAWRRRRRTTAV